MRLSPHFTSAEFRDRRTGRVVIDLDLVARLERLRTIIGRPLPILSGFREASTNAAVGGAKASQHLLGRAVDIPSGLVLEDQARRAGFTGVGLRERWVVHLDVRHGTFTRWRY